MQVTCLHIKNFKNIRDLRLTDIENAMILVGKNNTGKTTVLDAVRIAAGSYTVADLDFNSKKQNIELAFTLSVTETDLQMLHRNGIVSQYRRFEAWEKDFKSKLPSFRDGILEFVCVVNHEGKLRYGDGFCKHNKYIPQVFPKTYFIDAQRELHEIQDDLLMFQEDTLLKQMRSNSCMFDHAKQCNRCFQCIGLVKQKTPDELNVLETAKLLEYKLYCMNITDFEKKVNDSLHKNNGFVEEIRYTLRCDTDQIFTVYAESYNKERKTSLPVEKLGKGMKNIYMLSLLEAYVNGDNRIPSILLLEDPEIFLHPKLQKICGEILYRLSKKNQVLFSTHSPNLLFNFSRKQIRQIVLDHNSYTAVKENTNIGSILDDLGYTANDFLNVSFVFIVEGKQDKSRLPLLLEKYYSEIYDEKGNLSRISIITTNSCTNIKTYANLKYMNQVYLRDQFLMIRDGDGKDHEKLAKQLCRYYEDRNLEDVDRLPKVTQKNVLVLKYYSFENYFLNPSIMVQIGVLEKEEDFYHILLQKWKEYLYRIRSGIHFQEVTGVVIETEEDLKAHMEEIKIYMRGHNLYDIFYNRYKEEEAKILKNYIDLAPKEEFQDILDAIDRFIYFESKKQV